MRVKPDINIKSRWVENRDKALTRHDFGVVDSKGRKIGATVQTYVEVFEAIPEDEEARSWNPVPAGAYFTFHASATRDGISYGASHRFPLFTTAAERDAAVAKYLADARKRAAKLGA